MQRWQKKRQTNNGRKQTVNCYSCHALSFHGCLLFLFAFVRQLSGRAHFKSFISALFLQTHDTAFFHFWFDFGFGIRRFPFLLPQIGVNIMCACVCEWIKNELAKIDLIQINSLWPSHSHWHHIAPPFFYTLIHRWVFVIRQIVLHTLGMTFIRTCSASSWNRLSIEAFD